MSSLKSTKCFLALLLGTAFLSSAVFAEEQLPHPSTYMVRPAQVSEIKKSTDDPTDLMVTLPPKKFLPPEIYELMTFDIEEAKGLTEELVGFRSPDLVGKIAPEIGPGKYTYKDLQQSSGLKDLFPPEMAGLIKLGGPPLIASIPEFEIIPTRQLYWYLNLCKITKQNLGKTKLDKDGYIVPWSWEGGYPFPRPSGKLKAQEVYYSFEKRFGHYDFCFAKLGDSLGFNKNLKMDSYALYEASQIKLMGRTLFPPYGWFDKRAKKNGEFSANSTVLLEPRAKKGTIVLMYRYDSPFKADPWMTYVPSLRRIRKMSATDTQDPMGDSLFDDRNHVLQKITPKKFPYKFDIIAEREYFMPVAWNTGKAWVDSKAGYALREVQLMRRPCYVLQMTQLDPNYAYSKRVIYIDKENFMCLFSANYDSRGQLYRTQLYTLTFIPDIAQETNHGTHGFQFDHIDLHSTMQTHLPYPAVYSRQDFSLQHMIKRGK